MTWQEVADQLAAALREVIARPRVDLVLSSPNQTEKGHRILRVAHEALDAYDRKREP